MQLKQFLVLTILASFVASSAAWADEQAGEAPDAVYGEAVAKLKNKSFAEASDLFRIGAERGHRDSQYYLGLMYAKGDGVEQDYKAARNWLEKAAMNGYPKAMYHLGEMYVWGDGVEVDYEQATVWFWLATGFGDKYAQKRLRTIATRINADQLAEAEVEMKRIWQLVPHDLVQKKQSMH